MSSAAAKTKESPKFRSRRFDALYRYGGVALIILMVFILGGGVYDIIARPGSTVYTSKGTYSSISPYPGEQTINESIVSMFLYGAGIVGLYLAYSSTQVLYDKSKANLSLMVGLGLAVVGFAGAYILLIIKSNL